MKNTVYKISKDNGLFTSVKTFKTLYAAIAYLAGIGEKRVKEKVTLLVDEYTARTGGKTRLLDVKASDGLGNTFRLWAENEKTRREYVK